MGGTVNFLPRTPAEHTAVFLQQSAQGGSPVSVDLPRVHLAGSDAHYDAHIEVGRHGFALFLAPDAVYPMLDIDGTPQQLDDLVRRLQAALASLAWSGLRKENAIERHD
jgi:hypothetical protein